MEKANMTKKDKELLKFYNLGWHNECFGSSSVVPEEYMNAYLLGSSDFILELESVDNQDGSEILKRIKEL